MLSSPAASSSWVKAPRLIQTVLKSLKEVAEASAPVGGIPDDGPVELDATQQECMRSLIAGADGLPDRARERITAAIDSGTIENPERLKGMQERMGLDIDSCFPRARSGRCGRS